MKWSTAIRTLKDLAYASSDLAASPAANFALPVTQLWAAGRILEAPQGDLDWVAVAVVADLPVEDVPWLTKPRGAEHWENVTRAAKRPVVALWRSSRAPVWNHSLDRPALFWDAKTGLDEEALAALSDGRADDVRIPAPPPGELRSRLEDDLAVSLAALRDRTRTYEDRRWSPGKLTAIADPLAEASTGYFDLLDALAAAKP